MKVDELPLVFWWPLMKVTYFLYWKVGFKPAGRLWRAL